MKDKDERNIMILFRKMSYKINVVVTDSKGFSILL